MFKSIEKFIPDKRKELKHLFANKLSYDYFMLGSISRLSLVGGNLYKIKYWKEYDV